MINEDTLARHYAQGNVLEAITAGIARLGKTPQTVTIDDLAPVDEFHVGGREATSAFLDQLGISGDDHLLDIGCGLGGASRLAAHRYGCRVTGIDLTAEYVQAGNTLCAWLGMADRIRLEQGNATVLMQPAASFDRATMLHVGMNIADKQGLARGVWRVLRPGGVFGIYDLMRVGDGELTFPVPWASEPGASALARPDDYHAALVGAGFEIIGERNRREFALEFYERMRGKAAAAGGPPPLGLHLLMGPQAATKLKNMIQNIARGNIAPIELIARKPG
ncbi:MAG: class I SAM-dependent methyltransferase [Burkholderiaceae bacterium]